MIRTGGDEFFIEPLKDDEEESEGERRHVVYRSSAIIRKPSAANQTSEDFLRGESSTGSVLPDLVQITATIRRSGVQIVAFCTEC